MPRETGSPETQVIVYAIQRGEYDNDLSLLDAAIHRRRQGFDRLGIIVPSRGDFVEVWDDPTPSRDVKVPESILGLKFQVVGFKSGGVVAPLRCRVVTPFQTKKRSYDRGDVIRIERDWVYRVIYAPIRQE